MKSEFETLEQYQDSMKKFNENTRMGFEKFIQSHGSDRNKLQLRCTPYTDKKGGYGSFDLDFGLSVYQHQQSKVDELKLQVAEMKSRLNDAYTDGQSAMYAARQTKVDELQYKAKLRESDHQALLVKYRATKKCWEDMSKEKDELQKRVDAVRTLIEEYRDPPTEDKTFQHALSIVAYELEQALKGGLNE